MEIKPYRKSYRDEWEQLCDKSDDSWFFNTRAHCDYVLSYHCDSLVEDVSFVCFLRGYVVAVLPAMILRNLDGENVLSFADKYIPWPVFDKNITLRERGKIEKLLFSHLYNIALEFGVKKIQLYGTVLAKSFYEPTRQQINLPLKYGYIGHVVNTHVIDTSQPLEELWRDVRKGHRSAIKSGKKELDIEYWMGEDCIEPFEEYKNLHALAAGRTTRPANTFLKMAEWICNGNGMLVGAKDKTGWIGFVYFLIYKKAASYASAANHPKRAKNVNVGHALVWNAIEKCNEIGVDLVDMGLQTYSSHISDDKLNKEISISMFKRGFGGYSMSRFESTIEINK